MQGASRAWIHLFSSRVPFNHPQACGLKLSDAREHLELYNLTESWVTFGAYLECSFWCSFFQRKLSSHVPSNFPRNGNDQRVHFNTILLCQIKMQLWTQPQIRHFMLLTIHTNHVCNHIVQPYLSETIANNKKGLRLRTVLFGDGFIFPRQYLWHGWFGNTVEKPERIKSEK